MAPTPGGVLAKELQKREEELNKNTKERIKIVEKGLLKIKGILAPKTLSKNQIVRRRHAHCALKVNLWTPIRMR